MREQREPWLRLPAKNPGTKGSPRVDPRFRTHAVAVRQPAPTPAASSPEPQGRTPPGPKEPRIRLPAPPAGVTTSDAIERAAAAAPISRRAVIRLGPRGAQPPVATEPSRAVRAPVPREAPRAVPKSMESRAPTAPEVGLDDLPAVSSADWAVSVGEAAKMVDVVVVFYSVAYLGSEMFRFAYRTVVNQVLPQLGRPYTVYRFSLDSEPGFVAEMAESLGLPLDNPVTVAGFAWSGPGRRLFVLGDHAFQSPAVFQRSLRESLLGQPARGPGERAPRRQPPARLARPRAPAPPPLGRRVLAGGGGGPVRR